MNKKTTDSEPRVDRRRFMMAGAGALAGTMALPGKSEASGGWGRGKRGPVSAPNPIPGGTDLSGFGLSPPYDFIHWFAPGPVGITLPFTGVPLEGLDVEPSTLTDFRGSTAYTYLVGQAKGDDGDTYDLEVDLRVFDGKYISMDGEINYATFALL